jgi:CheY-like chemotaxis protein
MMATILVIDDDRSFRRMVNLVLTRAHHAVIEAQDGVEGLQLFTSLNPDVVISDIIMPDKDGIQLIREIRALNPTIHIIAMSGGGAAIGMGYLGAAGKLGADRRLAKPFRPTELTEMVEQLLADGPKDA